MTTMTREQAAQIQSRSFNRARNYSARRPDVALSRLVDELVIAFFVAMAVMWVVTTITGIFG